MTPAAAVAVDRPLLAGPSAAARRIRVALDRAGAGAVETVPGASPAFLGRRAWFEASGDDLATLVARRGRTAIAALPTRRARPFVREVPGSYWPFRGAALSPDADEAELAILLSDPLARRTLGPAWRLGPVLEGEGGADRLAAAARAAGWTVLTRRLGTTYMLDLAGLAAGGKWPKGSTLRRNRWHERHLAEQGALDYRFVRGRDWSAATFDLLAAVEAKSWVGTDTDRSGAKFLAPASRRIWEAAAADPVLRDTMSATILTIGGDPAAFALRLTDGPVSHCVANGYDPRYAHHSPGRLLLYRDFVRAAEEGVERIGWGAGDPGYKSDMGAEPGPAVLDYLFVRSRAVAALLRRFWER